MQTTTTTPSREDLEKGLLDWIRGDLHPRSIDGYHNLQGVSLDNIEIRQREVHCVNFSNANLPHADFSGSSFYHCVFNAACLYKAILKDTKFYACTFAGADLTGTGMAIIQTTYTAIIYPDHRLQYGCECMHVWDWEDRLEELIEHHEPDYPNEYANEIAAILNFRHLITTKTCD